MALEFLDVRQRGGPSGSFYTEPSHVAHFAQTGDEAAVVQITGYGPTGTTYLK
ncbi:MAG: hypothetical protein JST12_14935 [Armatimonadetes bacterium]|nr:hypothetical protein [Armatimonadota bacterium]